jgi:diguanylate cyclase (GGDEF)-like protein/PAS domain S-box-containing protein
MFQIMDCKPGAAPPFAEHARLYTPESWERLHKAVTRAMQDGAAYSLELQFLKSGGSTGWLEARGEALFGANGQVTGLRGTVQDITKRRALMAEVAQQHELLRVTLQSIGDAVITTNAQGLVTWLNPVAAQMVGWSAALAKGRPLSEVFRILDDTTRQAAANRRDEALGHATAADLAADTVLMSRDAREFCIETSVAPIRGELGETLGEVLVFHDVTDQRRQNKEITYRAQHDSLTGLINRAEFEARLERTQGKAKVEGTVHTLMYIDLDQFKIVNDTCGHAAGDQLLQNVATLLKSVARKRDTVARLGGDEFGILLEHCALDDAECIGQQICNRLNESRFIHQGERFRIGASIGLAPIDAPWDAPSAIMQAADQSCYAAKEGGRNRIHTWFEADETLHARQSEMRWATRLQSAFDEGQFHLFAQRIIPTDCGHGGEHLEVLLRLVESDGTVIAPGAFFPAAERFDLAPRIDRLVLRMVVDRLIALPELSQFDSICVNISGQSIGDRAFHREAISILSSAGAAVCQRICLEITETAAITNLTEAKHFIEQVKRLGIRIALDDFGAGATTFSYLKSLPIDILKIDGQFVRNVVSDPFNEAAIRCFVDLARIMGVKVVAECVETDAVYSHLKKMGVDYVQGFLFHRPEPLDAVLYQAVAVAAE